MKKLLTSDVYQVRSSYMLDLTGYKTVLQLYQPLIGMEATALYLTLNSELDQMTLTKSPSLISRLCKLSGFSLNSLQESFDKLEAVGLVCSYVKQTNDNRYLFDLKMPLSPQEFINHQILNRLLKDRLKDEYEKTIAIFQTYNVNLNDYQEMTASFTDVFEIHHHEKNILKEKKYKQKIHNSIENSYDLTLFYQGIENLQLSKKMFDQEDEKIKQEIIELTKDATSKMEDMKKFEGIKMAEDINKRMDKINEKITKISCNSTRLIEEYIVKLEKRIKEILKTEEVDKSRLAQEVVIYADKCSIEEEVTRLKSHISQFKELINSDDAVGKKLDFIIQEMNRETNTIGSKANNLEITNGVIDIKTEIENIREQVQNIE